MNKAAAYILGSLFAALLSFNSHAYDDRGGDEFRQIAVEHEMMAGKHRRMGNTEKAALYARMAAIKHFAAALADEGRWDEMDWSEYLALEAQLNESWQAGLRH